MSCLKLFYQAQNDIRLFLEIFRQENAGYKMQRYMRIIYDSTYRKKKEFLCYVTGIIICLYDAYLMYYDEFGTNENENEEKQRDLVNHMLEVVIEGLVPLHILLSEKQVRDIFMLIEENIEDLDNKHSLLPLVRTFLKKYDMKVRTKLYEENFAENLTRTRVVADSLADHGFPYELASIINAYDSGMDIRHTDISSGKPKMAFKRSR